MFHIWGLFLMAFCAPFPSITAFKIKEAEVSHPRGIAEGGTVTLKCSTDNWFEYCYWRHKGRLCEFEWKRNAWAIRQQSCHGLNSRVKYIGDYDSHECKIELSDVGLDDAGNWTCDMESYVTGDHVSGYKVKRHLELIVLPKSDERDDDQVPEITTESAEVIETVTDDASGGSDVIPTLPSAMTTTEDGMVITEDEDGDGRDGEEYTTEDPKENEIDDYDAMKQQDEEPKGAKMESVPIILGTCAGLFCIIFLAVYTVIRRKQLYKFGQNKDLEENMTQSMKNLEAQNNLIESEESEDIEDFQDEDTRHSMKYKGSFAYDPQ